MTHFVSKRFKLSMSGGAFLLTMVLSAGAQSMDQGQGVNRSQSQAISKVPMQQAKKIDVVRTHKDTGPTATHQDLKGGKEVLITETDTTVTYVTTVKKFRENEYDSDEEYTEIQGTVPTTKEWIKKAECQKAECQQTQGKVETKAAVKTSDVQSQVQGKVEVKACDTQSQVQGKEAVKTCDTQSQVQGKATVKTCDTQSQVQGKEAVKTCDTQSQVKTPIPECHVDTCHEFTFLNVPHLQLSHLKLLHTHRALKKQYDSYKKVVPFENFKLVGLDFGHHLSHDSHRAINWNDRSFRHFAMDHVTARSVNIKRSNLEDFYLHGELMDWNFKGSTLTNGWFNAELKTVDFTNAKLNNIIFLGSDLDRTKYKLWNKTTFEGAELHNVSFEGADISQSGVSFAGAKFYNDSQFVDTHINFVRNFQGAQIIDNCNKVWQINQIMAQKLDNHYRTWELGNKQSFTCQELVTQMQQWH